MRILIQEGLPERPAEQIPRPRDSSQENHAAITFGLGMALLDFRRYLLIQIIVRDKSSLTPLNIHFSIDRKANKW